MEKPQHHSWIEKLPPSKMVYPEQFVHRIKYYLWRLFTPYHPTFRDGAIALRIVRNHGRQAYLLGTIANDQSVEEFVSFLVGKGYAHHRVAWTDEGEVVSLRLVTNFMYQYHIRVFEDGEVRGHYEYTPECYPLLHMWDIGREERREEFLGQFGDTIIPSTSGDQSTYRWGFPLLSRRRRE